MRIMNLKNDVCDDKYFSLFAIKAEAEKIHNAEIKRLAEKIRLNIEAELINSNYSKFGSKQSDISFLDYFEKLTKERWNSAGNYANWDSTYKILKHVRRQTKVNQGLCSVSGLK